MRKHAFPVVGICLTIFASACTIDIMPSSMEVNEIVQARPKSHIGQAEKPGSLWRKIEISIPKSSVLSLRNLESTYLVRINNCADEILSIEELYANDLSLAQLSSMNEESFNLFYMNLRDPVVGYIYLKETTYANEARICALFDGGGMTGARIKSRKFRIK